MAILKSLAGALMLMASLAWGDLKAGHYDVVLLDKQGNEFVAGTLDLQAQGSAFVYTLHMQHDRFRDYFLSMKEMKCLEGPELWCHLPYPYPQPRKISDDDMRWLSHDLLFMFKKPKEFGANFWNGIYYQMRVNGSEIVGQAQAVDLNMLASPPQDPEQPPLGEFYRDEVDRDQRWLPDLVIHLSSSQP